MLVLKTPCESCLQFLLKQVGSIVNDAHGTFDSLGKKKPTNCVYHDMDTIQKGYVPPYQIERKKTLTMHRRVWVKTSQEVGIGMEATVPYGKDYWKAVEKALLLTTHNNLGGDGGQEKLVCVFSCVYVKSEGVGADTFSCLFLSRVQMVHSELLSLTLADIIFKKAGTKHHAHQDAPATSGRMSKAQKGLGASVEVCVCLYVCVFARSPERIGFPVCSCRFVPVLFLSRVPMVHSKTVLSDPKPDIKSGTKRDADEKDGPVTKGGNLVEECVWMYVCVCVRAQERTSLPFFSLARATLTPLFIYSP